MRPWGPGGTRMGMAERMGARRAKAMRGAPQWGMRRRWRGSEAETGRAQRESAPV